jgi:hypothetical protein
MEIKKNILEIKELVKDLHCMGTYGMVELELTKIEKYVKDLEESRTKAYELLSKFSEESMCSVTADEMIFDLFNSLDT